MAGIHTIPLSDDLVEGLGQVVAHAWIDNVNFRVGLIDRGFEVANRTLEILGRLENGIWGLFLSVNVSVLASAEIVEILPEPPD